MKVMFMRGNELLRDRDEDVGGKRVYGGAILSKNPKNNLKWLKVNIQIQQQIKNSLDFDFNPFLDFLFPFYFHFKLPPRATTFQTHISAKTFTSMSYCGRQVKFPFQSMA